MPYQAGSLDGIFFECSLSQMEPRRSALAEANRALKAGGRLVLSDIYSRNERPHGFLPARSTWQTIITDAAFTVLLFADKSDGLAEFAARLLWQHGSAGLQALCGCDMDALRAAHCGYFLLIARKGAA